jgi:hypothetical protein
MKSVSVGRHYFTVVTSVLSHECTGWWLYTIAMGAGLTLQLLMTGYSLMECTVVWILRDSMHIHLSCHSREGARREHVSCHHGWRLITEMVLYLLTVEIQN